MYTTKDYILGGVANAHLFAGDDLYCDAITTLTDSGMNIQISAEEVRGGQGAALLGRYFHSSGMTLTLTNATFNLAYLAASVGAELEAGGEVIYEEQLTAASGGSAVTLTPTHEIAALGCDNHVYAWYKTTDADATYTRGTVNSDGKITGEGLVAGTSYCVKYFGKAPEATEITVKSDFVPKTLHLVLDAKLYAVGDTATNGQTAVGKVVIDVPAFQLNGNQDLTMNMTGAATLNLEGTALAVKTCDASCKGGKYYAKIVQVIEDTNWYEGVTGLAVDGGEVVARQWFDIYAIYKDKTPQLITTTMQQNTADRTLYYKLYDKGLESYGQWRKLPKHRLITSNNSGYILIAFIDELIEDPDTGVQVPQTIFAQGTALFSPLASTDSLLLSDQSNGESGGVDEFDNMSDGGAE